MMVLLSRVCCGATNLCEVTCASFSAAVCVLLAVPRGLDRATPHSHMRTAQLEGAAVHTCSRTSRLELGNAVGDSAICDAVLVRPCWRLAFLIAIDGSVSSPKVLLADIFRGWPKPSKALVCGPEHECGPPDQSRICGHLIWMCADVVYSIHAIQILIVAAQLSSPACDLQCPSPEVLAISLRAVPPCDRAFLARAVIALDREAQAPGLLCHVAEERCQHYLVSNIVRSTRSGEES